MQQLSFVASVQLLICWCLQCRAQLSASDRQLALDFHIQLRSAVYPSAANMRMLTWSDRLADLAQRAADRCVLEHNYGPDYSGLGENIYLGGADIKSAIMMWYTEGENYNWGTKICAPGRYPAYTTCGHWSQVVQAEVTQIGCASKSCSGPNMIVCEYDKPDAQPPYKTGAVCSQCPDNAFYCYNGACLTPEQRNALSDKSLAKCQPLCNNCQYVNHIEGVICRCENNATCTASGCSAAGTPCIHGTDASSGGSCTCACKAGYSGPQCQYNNNQLDNGVQIRFAGGVRSCSYYPTPIYAWSSALQVPVKAAVAKILSDFCAATGNSTAAQLCCPDNPAGAGSRGSSTRFLGAADIQLSIGGYPMQEATGEAKVALHALLNATDAFCGRANASQASHLLNLTGFLQVLRDGNATMGGGIGCCGHYATVVTSARSSNTIQYPTYCLSGGGGSSGGGRSESGSRSTSSDGLTGAPLAGAILGAILGAAALAALIIAIQLVIVPKCRKQPPSTDQLFKTAKSESSATSIGGSETTTRTASSSSASAASLRPRIISESRVHPMPQTPPATPPPTFLHHLDIGQLATDGADPPVFNIPGRLMGLPFVPDAGAEPPPSFLRQV